jgi:hypothetical protein
MTSLKATAPETIGRLMIFCFSSKMKKALGIIVAGLFSLISLIGFSQTTIFLESIGNCCSTNNTTIVGTTFDNNGLTFTGDVDTRTTTPSTGYTGASGSRNVFITNTVGRFFQISGINTLGYSSITLTLGHYKSTTAGNNELNIEVSADGTNWSSLTYTRASGTGTASWIQITPSGTIPSTANLRIRFTQTSSTTQFRIDDIHLQGVVTCATPTQMVFSTNSFSATQDVSLSSFDVSLECVSGVATGCNNGTITLTTSGCGISGTLTKNVVNGVATYDDIVFLRSVQNNITFMATYTGSCSGLLNATSAVFTVQAPIGGSSTTVIRHQNFSTNPAPWSHTLGTPISIGTGGTAGTDVWSTASGYLVKSYSECNSAGDFGTTNTATFDNVVLTAANQYTFKFKVASLKDNSCGNVGGGNDNGENLTIETRLNGGAWQTLLTHNGSNNRVFPFSSSPLTSLSLGANVTYVSGQDNSAFEVVLPIGSTQFQFRITATNNRQNEFWAIDDILLEEKVFVAGAPLELPNLNTNSPINTCPSSPINSAINLSNTVGAVTYLWTPSTGVSNTTIANPTFTVASTSSFTLTITDSQNCTTAGNLDINVPSGSAGNWTALANNDWYNCLNWGNGLVPTSSTNVTIDNTALNNCEIDNSSAYYSGNATANSLTLTNNTLEFTNSSSQLVLHGNLTLSSGTSLLDMSNGGTLQLRGDFINNNSAAAFAETNSSVIFNGTSNQSIQTNSFNEVFANVTINKTAGVLTLQAPLEIINHLNFTEGIINSTNSNLLIFRDNAIHSNISHASHTKGPVRKIGNDAFVFPVGNGTYFRPIAISAPSAVTDHFTAQFFDVSPDAADGVGVAAIEAPIVNISDCEHWILDRTNGSSSVFVTLSYEDYSLNNCSGVIDPTSLRVARWDDIGEIWKDHGGVGIGAPSGTITTSAPITSFSPFALATTDFVNPLPAELISFKAEVKEKKVALEWTTASEINVDYFEVQRSTNGVDFVPVGYKKAAGNTTIRQHYQFVDEQPLYGLSYYRLHTVDFDGSSKTSSVRSVYFAGNAGTAYLVHQDQKWSIYHTNLSYHKFRIEVYDASGKLVEQLLPNPSDGAFEIGNDHLERGVYLIRLTDGDQVFSLKAMR